MNKSNSCVVMGGNGFLGQRLCKRLISDGCRVISVSRSGAPIGVNEPWCKEVEWIAASMASEKSLELLDSAEYLFLLASSTVPSTSNSNIAFDLESNVIATVAVLEAAVKQKVRHVAFVSSGGTVYGILQKNPIDEAHTTDPICSYGIHKLAIEKYLQLFRCIAGLNSIVLRVSNLYGESQNPGGPVGAVTHFTEKALRGIPIEIWGDGGVIRDYVHVDDVVEALVSSMTYRGPETIFNIGTGRGVSLRQLIEMIQSRISAEVAVEFKPPRGFDVRENVLDVSRAHRELQWAPSITLESGLDRMIKKIDLAIPPTQ
jgi:UDP-glucose 4-epimerase